MHRQHRGVVALVGFVLMLAGSPSVNAAEERTVVCPICNRARSESAAYGEKVGHTLARGTANALLGWTEIIRQPAQEAKAGGNVFTGMAKGVVQSVKRTAVGVGEVLTCWTPKVQKHYVHFAQDCPLCMGKRELPAGH